MSSKFESIMWWESMTFEQKFYKVIEWLLSNKRNTTSRHPDYLTDGEISNIYRTTNNLINEHQ